MVCHLSSIWQKKTLRVSSPGLGACAADADSSFSSAFFLFLELMESDQSKTIPSSKGIFVKRERGK
jgi:hypothetical protein